jgi:peptide/nickel transport system permease protein
MSTVEIGAVGRHARHLGGMPVGAAVIMCLVVLIAVFAPLLTPYDPTSGALKDNLLPPFWLHEGSWSHPLGTDMLGRDVFSRLVYGARASVTVALIAIFVAGTIGTIIGVVGGYFGGWTDILVMRMVDLMLSMPLLLMAFVLAFVWGPSFINVIIVLVLFLWAQYARQVRGEVLTVRERDFVSLARVAGASHIRTMLRHIFPNVVNTLIVLAMLQVGRVILLEASLSFLGVGLPPPQPAWGLMVADGRGMLHSAWWISVAPGVAIIFTIVSLNVFGDWLRDMLDPKLRQV